MSLCAAQTRRISSRLLLSPWHVRLQSTSSPSVSTTPISLRISPSGASYYWDTPPPTPAQVDRAMKFYARSVPIFLYSSATFRDIRRSSLPEVAFFGRSNVGKSSLLNMLMKAKLCHTSSKPGRTRTMNFYAVGGEDERGNKGRLVVMDMPGYGKGSQASWGEEIEKYLSGRRGLKRAFLLIDALHGLKPKDKELLAMFRKLGVPHQVILSKVDRVVSKTARHFREKLAQNRPILTKIVEDLREKVQPGLGDGPEALGEVITSSALDITRGNSWGVGDLRWATLAATGLGEEKSWPVDLMMQQLPQNDRPERIVSHEDLIVR